VSLRFTIGLLAVAFIVRAQQPHDRITAVVDEAISVPAGTVHPALARATASLPVDPGFPISHMILMLQPDAAQQAALQTLTAQQSDPASANYHKFLTPDQFAASFGASQNDIDKLTAWLADKGFQVEEVTPNHLAVVFSGTAAQVRSAFATEIRQYVVNGQTHYANASVPQIPAAFSGVVVGFVKLHDFHHKPAAAKPQMTSGSSHYLAPADYGVIYDLNSLYSSSVNGTGQSIAVIGRSQVNTGDIATFRSQFGLTANNPTTVLAGADPGFTGDGDALEATLDAEWAGAVAPHAAIKLVIAASTLTTDGIDLAAQYAVNHNVAPVISVSFGACEAEINNAFYNSLWQQAAAQGISVFVSAGDSGAAGCDGSGDSSGTVRAVNGICTSPYSTCVGGTQFNDTADPAQYWLSGNNAVMGSARSYIPEQVWNESGADLAASGGGASSIYAKPVWQAGSGVPADGQRDVPDVSLAAAAHDGYLLIYGGSRYVVGGTSASSPSFAGIMALVLQKYGLQGSVNANLYSLATLETSAFHDITLGNNSVPGVTGFSAAAGYDLASGLGSVDGAVLVNNWNVAKTFALTASSSNISATPTQPGSVTLTATASGGFTSAITLKHSTLPIGITAVFNPAGIAGGSGASTLTFTIARTMGNGSYPVTVTATGGGVTKTVSLNLQVTVQTACTLGTVSAANLVGTLARTAVAGISCSNPQGSFPSDLILSVSGLAPGMTATFSPSTLTPGINNSALTVKSSPNVPPGTYPLTVTATLPNSSPAFTQTISVPYTVTAPTTFTLTPSVTSLTFLQGASSSFTMTSAHSGAFNSAIKYTLSNLPGGLSGTVTPSTIAAPGDGTATVALQATSTMPVGTYTIIVFGQGGGLSLGVPITVKVTTAPAFTFSTSQTVLTARQNGAAATVNLTVANLTGGFNSAVTLAAVGLPTGVTASFAPASLAAPGSGVTVLSLSAASNAPTGPVLFSVTATGGTITRGVTLQLLVTPPPVFSIKASVPAYNMVAGNLLTETITATGLYGYNSNLNLTVGALPAGVTATFAASTINGLNGNTTLNIVTSSTLAAGTYSIVVTATDPVTMTTATATISLEIGSVTTTLSAPTLTVFPGSSASITITATGQDYTGNVALAMRSLPVGVNSSLSSLNLPGSGSSVLTISPLSTAKPGYYTVYVRSAMGAVATLTPLTLIIN
jgi:subtilase family serine protease